MGVFWGYHEILNIGTLKISNHENTKDEVVPMKAGTRNLYLQVPTSCFLHVQIQPACLQIPTTLPPSPPARLLHLLHLQIRLVYLQIHTACLAFCPVLDSNTTRYPLLASCTSKHKLLASNTSRYSLLASYTASDTTRYTLLTSCTSRLASDSLQHIKTPTSTSRD